MQTHKQQCGRASDSKNPTASAFAMLEVLVGGAVLAIFAVTANYAMSIFNRNATINRNYLAAEAIVRNYLDQALAADWTPDSTPAILTDTSSATGASTDRDGDGEADGELYIANVPLITTRDSLTGNNQNSVIAGNLYRQVTVVDAALKIARVNFTLVFTYRNKSYSYRLATLKAQDQ